ARLQFVQRCHHRLYPVAIGEPYRGWHTGECSRARSHLDTAKSLWRSKPRKDCAFWREYAHGPCGTTKRKVAPAFLFLACEDSSYMSGQVLHPNGGTIVNG